MGFQNISIKKEGLRNHMLRLGEDYALWRKLVGDNPEEPIATPTKLADKMHIPRKKVYDYLKVDLIEYKSTGRVD